MWLLMTICLGLLTYVLVRLNKDYFILAGAKRVKTIDGSDLNDKVSVIPGKTIFGNNFDILQMDPTTIFAYLRKCSEYAQGKSYLWHFLFASVYNVTNAEDAEEILTSQAFITKGVIYDLLKGFLGDGLLISTDKKWHFRRKILTPAFHFNVLQNFLVIFKQESDKLQEILDRKVDQILNLSEVIPQFTLNNICETALGVKLDTIEGSQNYRHSIHDIEQVNVHRACNPLLYFEIVFRYWGDLYKRQLKYLKIAHDFSSKIITEKRRKYLDGTAEKDPTDTDKDDFGKKKRYAMLDTLLDTEAKHQIDHEGICEEVDTFMFEGYDTTSTCLTFTLMHLARHPAIQERCFKEIEHFEDITDMSIFDLNNLEFLECVIKESLRLCPPVPFISRQIAAETRVNGLILPGNTQINVHIFDILRDPKHFPDPNKFDPDRFLPKNTINRHPFAYIPFSAGPRNCIGQKFALLEIKTLLAKVLKNYVISPVTQLEDITFQNGFVLRSLEKVQIKLTKRFNE